jgi:dihydrolipoamide dehydrogenase
MDPEISEEITRHLSADGVRILTGHQVLGVKHGLVQARNRSTGEDVEITAEMILVAIGRQAVVHPESYDQLGIQHSPKGIVVDDFMQTSVPSIWAIGDATGKSILAHVGMQQGLVCAENIMRPPAAPPRRMDYEVIPAVVYTIPEVVGVGTVPVDMSGVSVFKVPFTKNLRARIEDYAAGFVKIWVKENRVVAAQAIGHNVSEIMQELANMVALKTELGVVADIIHAHPTYSEITRSVLQYALGKAADFYLEE